MRHFINVIVPIALVIGLASIARSQMDLNDRFSALDARLVRLDARLDSAAKTRVVYRSEQAAPNVQATIATPEVATAPSADDERNPQESTEADVPVPSIAMEMTDRGYMYAGEWTDMESQLATMSVAENKKFWAQMFDALGSGELEVYDE